MSVISDLEVKIGADSSGLSKELAKSQAEIKQTFNVNPVNDMNNAINSLSGSINGIGSRISALVGIAATGFGLTSLVQGAIDAGAGVYQMAQAMHVSIEEATEFNRIMKLTGGETHLAETAFIRLDKTLTSNSLESKKCKATLDAMGVSLTDQKGNLLPLNDQLAQLAKGYQKASEAGHGQDYVMNTLGSRGISLIKTLKNYNEAKAEAAKIQGIGIDPKEMYIMQQELRTLQIQAGQLKIAFGSVIVDLFGGKIGDIDKNLASVAKYIADNRREIAATTLDVIKLMAALEGFKLARNIATKAIDTVGNVKNMFMVPTNNDATLTAQQERTIARRQALFDNLAKKEEAAYLKTVQAMQISEAEKTEIFNEYLIKREQASAASQAAAAESLTAMYEKQNAAAIASAEAQTAAINTVATAAQNAAAHVTEANELAAESTNAAVRANARLTDSLAMTADAARVSADQMIAGNEEVLASTNATLDAYVELGAGAEDAGTKGALAAEASTAGQEKNALATEASTLAQGKLASATEGAGIAAKTTGAETVAASFSAATGVKKLTAAVWALAGGWVGVAIATAMAVKEIYDYLDSLHRVKSYNKNSDVYYDKGKYYKRVVNDSPVSSNGTTQSAGLFAPYKTGDFSNGDNVSAQEDLGNVRELSPEEYEAQYIEDAEEVERKKRAQALEDGDIADLIDKETKKVLGNAGNLDEDFRNINAMTKEPKPKKAKAAKPVEVMHYSMLETDALAPYANEIEYASNLYGIDPNFLGSIIMAESSGNPNAVSSAGAIGLGQLMPDTAAGLGVTDPYDPNQNILGAAQYAASLYHQFGSYDLAAAGYNAGGGAVEKYGGIPPYKETQNYVATVMGYYDSSQQYLAPATEKNAQQEAAKKAQQLKEAQKEATELMASMHNSIEQETGTTYELGMDKVLADVNKKTSQIAKMQMAGVNVDGLKKELDLYDQVMQQKVVDAWRKSWSELKEDTAKALADVTNNYKAAADTQYETTVRKLDDERIERKKAVEQDKDDKVAMAAVETWYNAQVSEAIKKYAEELRDAHDKRMKALEDEGNYQGLLLEMQNGKSKDNQQSLDFKGQQSLAKEYHKLIDDMQRSTYQDLSDSASSFYSTMTSSMSDFITGTHGAMEVVKSFEKAVLNAIANIVAQRAAAQLTGSLLGAVGSAILPRYNYQPSGPYDVSASPGITAGGSVFGSGNYGFNAVMPQVKLAAGGIVSSPTVALIGEEPGVSEAVVPLKNGVLGGGNVEVNITNNTNDNVSLQSSHYDDGAQKMILNFVVDGVQRNVNNSANSLKSLLGGG